MSDLNAGALYLPVRPDLTGFQAQLTAGATAAGTQAANALGSSLSSRLSKGSAALSQAGRSLTRYVSLPVLGIGYAATKAALSYDRAFTQIAATTNTGRKQVEAWRKEVLALSGETARSPDELANALYFLSSAGLETSQVMDVLTASAKASASGLGETQDIARLTANVLNAYPDSALTAADAIDTLVGAVREGTADPDEFAGAMGRLLPIASKADVGFDQLAASLATVSNIGLDVNEGVTAMRGLLQALTAPTAQSTDALKKLGLSADDVRTSLAENGLLDTLDLLEEKSKGQIDVIQDLIPNVRSLTGFFGLQGQEAEKVDAIFQSVTNSTGDLDKAFAETARSDSFKFDRAMNRLRVAGVRLGNQLIPILTDHIVPAIQSLVDGFEDLSPTMKDFVVKGALVAALAGPFLRLAGVGLKLGAGLAAAAKGMTAFNVAAVAAPAAGVAGSNPAGLVPTAASGLLGPKGQPLASTKPLPIPKDGILGAIGPAVILTTTMHDLGEAFNALQTDGAIGFVEEELNGWTASILDSIGPATGFLGPVGDIVSTLRGASNTDEFKAGLDDIGTAMRQGKIDAEEAKTAVEGLAESYHIDLPNGADAAVEALERANEAIVGPFARMEGQSKEANRILNQQVKTYQDLTGKALKPNTIQMAKNLIAVGDNAGAYELLHDKVRDASRRIGKSVQATTDGAQAAREGRAAQNDLARGIDATGKKAKESAGDAEDLTGAIKSIPGSAITRVVAETARATAAINTFKNLVNSVPNSVTVVGRVIEGVGRDIGGDAAGNWFEPRHGGYVRRIAEGGEAEGVFNERQVKALHAMGIRDGAQSGARGSDGGGTMEIVRGRLSIDERGVAWIEGTARRVAREEKSLDRRYDRGLERSR